MSASRGRGDGGLHWDESRQRWIATITDGYDGRGKRVVRKRSFRTKTEARSALQSMLRDLKLGRSLAQVDKDVEDVVREWLEFGLGRKSDATRRQLLILCELHIIPHLGARKIKALKATEVDRWLRKLSASLSDDTLRRVLSCLRRSLRRAHAQDLVDRNVAEIVEVPKGQPGRPSKSLTAAMVDEILAKTRRHPMYAYIVVSLLTGVRTEELRALRWDNVHLVEQHIDDRVVPPQLEVWRSVRVGGDTKTRLSRRTLVLPQLCVEALVEHSLVQRRWQASASDRWQPTGLVFTTSVGTALDAANVRRSFRHALGLVPGIDPADWTPRELRHSFVSILSSSGVPIEEISRLVGHSGTTVTELIYRHELRPALQAGAAVMDTLFKPVVTQLVTQSEDGGSAKMHRP